MPPTEKRQRKKQGHAARIEAARLEARRQQRKRRRITMVILVAVILPVMLVISRTGGDTKGKTVAAGDKKTTTTTTPKSPPTSAKPAVPAAGGDARVTKLEIEDVKVGTGAVVKAGDTIVAHYLGATYKDGKEFQASWDNGQTFETVIGQGKVIKGWDEGIPGMKVGGRRKLIIPAADAYGDTDPGNGSPFGDLVFIVDVYAIK